MKVLMLTEKDAANVSLAKIAHKFLERGHEVVIYAPFFVHQVLSNFDKQIKKYPMKELTEEVVNDCDIIFCFTLSSVYMPLFVFKAKKPIFTYNYLLNRQINWGGDISFVPSFQTVTSDYDEHMMYSYIGIGDPKYDNVGEIKSDTKKFLFIDSGHYPFSDEGKCELAKTLLNICNTYKDYELVIKPRFLPGDQVITHRNNTHLYDVIKNICNDNLPVNMTLLDHHEDLKKLINECTTVICMYTTAFVGAVVSGKGLVVIENLKSEDVYDIREKTYLRNRENIVMSGALIDYHEVEKLLPFGAKADSKYLDFLLEEKEDVANKICETCEYLWDNFYRKEKFPYKFISNYKKYKCDIAIDPNMTWEKVISKRYHDYMLFKVTLSIDFHISSKADLSYAVNKANECYRNDGIITENEFREFLNAADSIRARCIILNREALLNDNIDSGILLFSYYSLGMYDEIRNFPNKDIAAYDFYRAKTALDVNGEVDYETAEFHLKKYFEKVSNRKYYLEISDMPNSRFDAFINIISILEDKGDMTEMCKYVTLMEEYFKLNYLVDDIHQETNDSLQIRRRDFILKAKEKLTQKPATNKASGNKVL